MRVALYERRSTDEVLQSESLDTQDEILRAEAKCRDDEIVRVYADSGSGTSIADRPAFRTMIADVRAGAPYEAILVRDVSRWGRFPDLDESAYWEFVCTLHGVRVIYVEERFHDDGPLAALEKTIKRAAAAQFSKEKARIVQRGQYRAVKRGFRLGGDAPYGMVRILVTRQGTPVQELQRGQRKLVSDHRMKLGIGRPKEVAIVRRIFRLFVTELHSSGGIVSILNRDNIPSPRGGRWRRDTVEKILTNPAYVGIARGRFRRSENFNESQNVLVENAWPVLVKRSVWDAAQRRFAERDWSRTPDGLAARLRETFERWGVVEHPQKPGDGGAATPETYRKYFEEGADEAIERAYTAEIAAARATVIGYLSSFFRVEDDGRTILLQGLMRVGFKAAFPRRHHLGGVHWRFTFDGSELQDVTIGMAFSPTKTVALYYRMVNILFRGRRKTVSPTRHSHATKTASRSLEQLARAFRRDLLRYSSVARKQFLAAVADLSLVNTYEVARSLGWPEEKGLTLYRKLRREGVLLPPLKKQAPGRRVTIVCDACGAERTMLVSNAMQHKTSLCASCWRASRARFRVCPDCGDRRRLGRGEFKRLSCGTRTPCRKCTITRVNSRRRVSQARDAKGRFQKARRRREPSDL